MALKKITYKLDNGMRLVFYSKRILPKMRKQWRWRVQAANNKTISGATEYYVAMSDADRSISLTLKALVEYMEGNFKRETE